MASGPNTLWEIIVETVETVADFIFLGSKITADAQTGFSKGKGIRDQIANIHWIVEKAREFQKNIYFCFIDYTQAFNCVDHSKLRNILEERGMPDHLTRNLYADEEATVRTRHGTTDWFKLGKGVHQEKYMNPYANIVSLLTWNMSLELVTQI